MDLISFVPPTQINGLILLYLCLYIISVKSQLMNEEGIQSCTNATCMLEIFTSLMRLV